jgi:hypothetical protein
MARSRVSSSRTWRAAASAICTISSISSALATRPETWGRASANSAQRGLRSGVVVALVFEVTIIPEDQVVVAQLVLDARGIEARLAARAGEHDNERIKLEMFGRRPDRQCEGCEHALGAIALFSGHLPLCVG